jgi:hypothetical protein
MARRNFNNSNPVEDQELHLEMDAAIKYLKASRNRAIFLRVGGFMPTKADADKGYSLIGHVKVNAVVAVKVLLDSTTPKMRDEALVTLHVHQHSIFIG